MNRFKIAGAALLMFAVAFGASAQTETSVCKENKECAKHACKDGKKCDRKVREGNRCAGMFEGIDLTPEQQAQIDQLVSECKERGEANRVEKKAASLEQRKNEHAELQSKVEKILTPEQYAIFKGNMDKKLARPMRGAQGLKNAQKEGCNLKADCKKEACAKGEFVKGDCKKGECKKTDCAKADCKKGDCKKDDCKKADCKKGDCKKDDCKKTDCKKK